MVQATQVFLDAAEMAVGVAHRAEGVLEAREGVLAQPHRALGVSGLGEVIDGLDHSVDPKRVIVHRAVIDEVVNVDRSVDGSPVPSEIDPRLLRLGCHCLRGHPNQRKGTPTPR